MRSFGPLLALTALLPGEAGAQAPAPPNVLVLVADDLGAEMLAPYGIGTDVPVTPNLDGLAAGGLLFRNAWSNPKCSPTRATILTGRYSFRTGIGEVVTASTPALALSEVTIPEVLDGGGSGYAHAAIGKWHLSNGSVGGEVAPNLAGFSHFDGSLVGVLTPAPAITYYHWPRVVNGVTTWTNVYNTTATVDGALSWIQTAPEPWFCYVAFHAPHAPWHAPPPGLHVEDLTGLTPSLDPRPFYKAMIEAVDAEVGRLLAGLGPALEDTLVVFLGDNGTPDHVTGSVYPAGRGKGTPYQGGVHVPLYVSGPLVAEPGSECDALVNTSDLFRTVAEVAGADTDDVLSGVTLDSVSLVPYLADPSRPSSRSWVFTERFQPVGPVSEAEVHERAIRDERYKLIDQNGRLELYDLAQDPLELADVFSRGVFTSAEVRALNELYWTMQCFFSEPSSPLAPKK